MKPGRTGSIPAFSPVPEILVSWLAVFRPCFTAPVWNHVLVLAAGAIPRLRGGKPGTGQTHRHPGVACHGAGGPDRLWPLP
jgi:hypothetical protein